MNDTNRGANRVFLALVGLLLIAAGAVPVLLAVLPPFAARWRSTAADLARTAPPWVADRVVGSASAAVIGLAVLALLVLVALLALVTRQGGGRTAAALEQRSGPSATRIDLAVPKALLEEHLRARSELVGLRITAYEVRHVPMLRISARCRRGVSPAAVADLVGRAVRDLESIVGTDVPALVRLSGGFRVRTAPAARFD